MFCTNRSSAKQGHNIKALFKNIATALPGADAEKQEDKNVVRFLCKWHQNHLLLFQKSSHSIQNWKLGRYQYSGTGCIRQAGCRKMCLLISSLTKILQLPFFCATFLIEVYFNTSKVLHFLQRSIWLNVIAYRFASFGYVPAQSYLLFGTIFLNILIIYIMEKILYMRPKPRKIV